MTPAKAVAEIDELITLHLEGTQRTTAHAVLYRALRPALDSGDAPAALGALRRVLAAFDGHHSPAATPNHRRPPALTVEVPPTLVGVLWRLTRDHLDRRRRNGGTVHPDERALCDTLRAAYLDQLQATSGHPLPGFPDMAPSSDHRTRTGPALVRTAQLADALGVTDRHARRLARAHGLVQPRRGLWRADDAAALIAARRNR